MTNVSRVHQIKNMLLQRPGDAFLLFALSQELAKSGAESESESSFRELITNHPSYVAAYYHFGKLLEKQQRYEEAMALFSQGIEIASTEGDDHTLKELKEALAAYDED